MLMRVIGFMVLVELGLIGFVVFGLTGVRMLRFRVQGFEGWEWDNPEP